jgi:hypothetical protein
MFCYVLLLLLFNLERLFGMYDSDGFGSSFYILAWGKRWFPPSLLASNHRPSFSLEIFLRKYARQRFLFDAWRTDAGEKRRTGKTPNASLTQLRLFTASVGNAVGRTLRQNTEKS